MNDRSRVPTESRDKINITRRQLNEWFNKNGDTESSPIEIPLDTTYHKNRRLKWCRDHYVKLTSHTYHVTYLDEKFFIQPAVGKRLNDYQKENMKRMELKRLLDRK